MKNQPGAKIEGSPLFMCQELTQWFVWKDQTFDIRMICDFLSKPYPQSLDYKNGTKHWYSDGWWDALSEEIVEIVGEEDFQKLIDSAEKKYWAETTHLF